MDQQTPYPGSRTQMRKHVRQEPAGVLMVAEVAENSECRGEAVVTKEVSKYPGDLGQHCETRPTRNDLRQLGLGRHQERLSRQLKTDA